MPRSPTLARSNSQKISFMLKKDFLTPRESEKREKKYKYTM